MSPPAGATWRLLSPAGRAGPVAMIEIVGAGDEELRSALDLIGIGPVSPGALKVRDLLGIDTGLVARFSERNVVLMPHGGAEVVRAMCVELEARGLRADTRRSAPATYPEAADGFEAEALRAIARAASPLAIDLLLDQAHRWRVPGARSDPARDRVLNRLIDPPLIVAIGASNIGKSTLVNALAGRSVSIVADEPGTTRDHVGVVLDLAGVVARWVDTPGMRANAEGAEREAADIALRLAHAADLVVLCGDADHDPPAWSDPSGTVESVRIGLRSDLGPPRFTPDAVLSVRRGDGIPGLVSMLRERLVPGRFLADPGPWKFWGGGESTQGPS